MKWSELSVEQRDLLIVERTKDTTGNFLACYHIADAGLWSMSECCDSCHEDDVEYGYDLCSVFLPDGRVLYCCCRLHLWIEDAVLDHKMIPLWVLDLEKSIPEWRL